MLLDAAQLDLLQRTIGVFYGGTQEQIAEADKTLDQLRGHPQPWCLVQQLVDVGSSPPAVLWSVSLVEQHLKRRWRRSTADERAACRSTVVALVMAAAAVPGEKVVAQKLQHLLALLLKAEWPNGWPSFVPDLLGAAQVGDEARLRILLLLGEEAFAHGTPARAAAVRSTLGAQSGPVLQLCVAELQAATAGGAPSPAGAERPRLALGLLARYAAWLPPTALLSAPILSQLPQLLTQRTARPAALKLLAELAALPPAGAAAAAGAPAQDAAWLALHRTLDASLHVAAAGGGAGGGGGAWREAERHDLVLCLRAMWRGQRAALLRAAGGGGLLARALQLLTAQKLVESAVCPVGRHRPMRPPGGSQFSGRSYGPRSAARASWRRAVAPAARLRPLQS